ncbi:MAG: nitrilase, partial [Bacillota bacterium]|nr:nitrilase [Bacillota bacterium]
IANSEEYHPWKALRGIWPRVQESYVFGLKASLNGWLGGMHFTGKAGIFAPLELTEGRDGVLALAGHWEGDELVTADLNLAALRRARQEAEYWGDANPAFEAGYWERTYGRGRIT